MGGPLSCGALFAASSLPAFGDEPTVFPARGDYERLSLTYHEIKAGATAPFTLLHFSDTHLAATYPHEPQDVRENMRRRTVIFGGRQEEALRDTLAWARTNAKGFDGRTPKPRRGDHLRQLNDPVTKGFIAHLKAQPLLKAILTGHLHIGIEERFSPTAMQYVVADNYMFHAAEILIT